MLRIPYYNTILSASIVTLAFIFYFLISQNKTVVNYLRNRLGEEVGQIMLILFQRLVGVLFFGIMSATIYLLIKKTLIFENYLRIQFNITSLFYILILGIIATLINYFAARSAENLFVYPQIRSKIWTLPLLLLSSLSWMGYLLAYEFMLEEFFYFLVKEN